MLAMIWNPIWGFGGMVIIHRCEVAHIIATIPKTCDGHHRLPERYGLLNRRLLMAAYK